jgi:hypothetical protein
MEKGVEGQKEKKKKEDSNEPEGFKIRQYKLYYFYLQLLKCKSVSRPN